jgi:hypothetical protein
MKDKELAGSRVEAKPSDEAFAPRGLRPRSRARRPFRGSRRRATGGGAPARHPRAQAAPRRAGVTGRGLTDLESFAASNPIQADA